MSVDVTDAFADDWESLIDSSACDTSPYGPVLHPLAKAARATALRQFFPFTSVNRLCFARTATWPFDGLLPAFASYDAAGEIVVFLGDPYADTWTEHVRTRNAQDAVVALAGVLTIEP